MDGDLAIHRSSNFITKFSIDSVESRRLVTVKSTELVLWGKRLAAGSGQAGSSCAEPALAGVI
jgi:hypothetical protein